MELIQGKVAGLNMTRVNGNPNSSMDIQLRVWDRCGWYKSADCDWRIPGELGLVAARRYWVVQHLKDGSAAAIYGSAETRGDSYHDQKGRAGAPQFNYSSYAQHEIMNKRPDVFDAAGFRNWLIKGLFETQILARIQTFWWIN